MIPDTLADYDADGYLVISEIETGAMLKSDTTCEDLGITQC